MKMEKGDYNYHPIEGVWGIKPQQELKPFVTDQLGVWRRLKAPSKKIVECKTNLASPQSIIPITRI